MIFKTFDSDNGFLSKIGVFNKSFAEIGKAFGDALNLSIKGAFDDSLGNEGFFKNLKNNLTTQVNEMSDLYSKLFVTKNDIEPLKKNLSIYEENSQDIFNNLIKHKKLVDDNKSSWQEYYKTLETKEERRWQAKFIQENDLTKISLEDVDAAQKAAKQSAIAHNNSLKQLTIGAKAANVALKATSVALNMGFAIVVSLVISKITEHIEKLKNATKDYREEQEKLIKEHDDRIQEYTDEIDKLNELHNKLVLAKNDRSALAGIYDDLNNAIGVSTGLLSGESNEYDIANQKILDRIEYLKQLREEENKDKNKDSIDYFKNNKIDLKGVKKDPKGSEVRTGKVPIIKDIPSYSFGTTGRIYNALVTAENINKAIFDKTGEFIADRKFGTNFAPYISEEFKNKVRNGIEISYQELIKEIMKNYSKTETEKMDMGWLWSTILGTFLKKSSVTESEFDDYLDTQYETALKIFDDFINSHTDSFSTEQSKEILKNLIGLHLDDFDSIEEDLKKIINNTDLSKAIDTYYESLNNTDIDSEEAYNNLFGIFEKLKNEYPVISKTLDDILLSVTKYTNKIYSPFNNIKKESLSSMYSKIKDQLTLIANAEKELSENGELSIETVISLIEKYPELESKLTSTATGYSLTSGTLQELIDSERTEYTNVRDNAKKVAEETLGAEYLKANAYDGTTESLKNQIKMRLKLYETEMSATWEGRLTNPDYDPEKFEAMLRQYRKLQEIWDSISSLDNAEENVKTFDDILKKIRNGVENNAKSSADAWKDAFDKELKVLKHSLAMDEITEKQYYSKLTILNNRYFKGKTKYLDEYNQYIEEIYSGEKKMQEEAVSAIESLRDLVANMIKQELNNQKDALKDELDSLNKILDARKEALDLAKEQNDYEKNLAEKNKAVADVEAELVSIRYDTIKKGDTLWNIAKEYYGNGKMWSKILEANPGINVKDLKIGQKLIIPFKTGGETGNYEGIGYLHKKKEFSHKNKQMLLIS